MTRPSPDRQPEIDGRLEYVRGLLEGGELSPDERRDRTMSELAAAVAELSSEVSALRAEMAALLAASPAELGNSGAQARSAVRSIFCPGCGAALLVSDALEASGVEVVSCRGCGAVVELV